MSVTLTHQEKALLAQMRLVRELQTFIREAINAIDRGSYEMARRELQQALGELPSPQRRREREVQS